MMATTVDTPRLDLTDLAEPVIRLAATGRTREAEVGVAYLGLWLLGRVEAGRTHPDDADYVFLALDLGLQEGDDWDALSEEASALILEGGHFHHWGGEDAADPAAIRRLAGTILEGPPN